MKSTMAIVKAKDDIKVLMEDGRFSNFIKGHTYRCMFKGEDVYVIDEDKYGFQTDLDIFHENFQVISNETK